MPAWTEKFAALTALTHSEQAQWYLNGFWEEGADQQAEEVWKIAHQFIEVQLDEPVRYGGKMKEYTEDCDLDEFKSHRILEVMGETLTVVALRKRLKELDIDNNKRMALSEYLLNKYNKTPEALVNSPQGSVDPAELAAATAACEKAGNDLNQATADATAASEALLASELAAAKAAETKETADAALAKAEEAEAVVKAAEAELQAAIDEITKLEEEKKAKMDKYQKIIDEPSTGTVKRGQAVQNLAALEAEDEMPMRKAKITQKAALKKVEKARKVAEAETAVAKDAADAAKAAKEAADAAKIAAEEAKAKADAAKAQAEESLKAAEAALEELKSQGTGSPQGKLWWMERILAEKKKFMK